MDKPEKIKIGCCPFCGGNIKRANMKAFSRQSQIYGFNLALDGVDATWGALIYNFSAELELSAEQTAKLTTLGEEYDKMIRSFREADLPPEEFAEYVVAKAEECKAAAPAESWMADLVPGGEYAISIAGHTLVLKPVPGTPAGIQRGHEYYHYTIGPRLYAGTFVGRMQH